MKELMCNGKMKTGGFWGNPAKAVLYLVLCVSGVSLCRLFSSSHLRILFVPLP